MWRSPNGSRCDGTLDDHMGEPEFSQRMSFGYTYLSWLAQSSQALRNVKAFRGRRQQQLSLRLAAFFAAQTVNWISFCSFQLVPAPAQCVHHLE